MDAVELLNAIDIDCIDKRLLPAVKHSLYAAEQRDYTLASVLAKHTSELAHVLRVDRYTNATVNLIWGIALCGVDRTAGRKILKRAYWGFACDGNSINAGIAALLLSEWGEAEKLFDEAYRQYAEGGNGRYAHARRLRDLIDAQVDDAIPRLYVDG